jgi:hypothetical protein
MTQDSIVYFINLIIGLILAGVMSRHWRLEVGGRALQSWIVSAWILALADLLFVLRGQFPAFMPRPLPTLMVTAGHLALLMAAHYSSGRAAPRAVVATVVALHVAMLTGFTLAPEYAGWRTVANGILWGGLSVAAAVALWTASESLHRSMFMPALVLAFQGAFHAVRAALATQVAVRPDTEVVSLIQLLGDLEVSLFMVALFVSVLVAFLERSYDELRTARDNVRQLASMLPLCSWCHKVRDDDGDWTRIEEYLAEHKIAVTHGLCESCEAKHFAKDSINAL